MEERVISSTKRRQQSNRARMNEQIRVPNVRLIGADGEQVGVVPTQEALQEARGAGLDLVEISPTAEPPVCRIMDYGKYLFELNKKQAAAKKKQKQIQVKEIKFRPVTEQGDFDVKVRKLKQFLESGDKVKVTIRFRGREMAHQEIGMELMARVKAQLEEIGVVEQEAKREGRQVMMVLAPKKK